MTLNKSRRDWLRISLGAVGVLASTSVVGKAMAAACGVTPRQVEGPFYPIEDQLDKDNDLTRVRGKSGRAKGEIILVTGQVLDEECRPVKKALVEIWQACATGRYNHPAEENTSVELDENFQYWGQAVTDSDGRYAFKTIVPGAYPAGEGWMRPPHIHFKVEKLGYHELTTQMYFAGHPLNDKDYILRALPRAEREKLVVPFNESGVGNFDLVLRKV